jgi:hypothetical protein
MEQFEFECRKFMNTLSTFLDSADKKDVWIQHAFIETTDGINPNEYKKCIEYHFFQECIKQRKIQLNLDENIWKSNPVIVQYIVPYRKVDIYN